GQARDGPEYGSEENAPALVQCVDREPAALRGEHQRRIDKPHVPPRIAAGKLKARGKQDAAPVVERLGERCVGRLVGAGADLASNADAAVCDVALGLHRDPLWVGAVSGDPAAFAFETAKAARCPWRPR